MQLSWKKIKLNLKETFSISYGNYSYRDALVVLLTYKGETGYGECTAIDYYGIKIDDLEKKITSIKTLIEKQEILYPTDFYKIILSFNLGSFLTSALDCAYWDLFGKLEKKNFIELNRFTFFNTIESSLTISVADVDEQIKRIENSKWSKFKIKCNGLDKFAIEKLANLPYSIAIDSNASFTKENCEWIENQEFSKNFSYWEQPTKPYHYEHLNRNKFANWMADEDCQNQINLRSLQPHYKSINIKLVKCGGLTPALELLRLAKILGFKIMIGCMTQSTIGISAGAVLTPLVDYADLDGANLISNDIANGSKIINGKIEISEMPGLGISIK